MTIKMKTASDQYLDKIAAHIQEGLLAAGHPETSERFAHTYIRSEESVAEYRAACVRLRAGQSSSNSLVGLLGRILDPATR